MKGRIAGGIGNADNLAGIVEPGRVNSVKVSVAAEVVRLSEDKSSLTAQW